MKTVVQVWPEEFAARYRRAGYWTGETFGRWLRTRAEAHPERKAIVGGEIGWTYAELDARAHRMAAGVLDQGLVPGDRVIVQLPNIPDFFAVVFGLFRAGLLPVFALPAHRRTEIVHFAKVAEAAAYIAPARHGGFDYRELASDLRRDSTSIRHVWIAGEPGPFGALEDIMSSTPRSLPDRSPSEVAFLQLSGGSTGLSKLIPRTHDDYIYSFRRSAEICRLGPSSVYLAVLPVAHNFPMSSPGAFGTLHAGGTVALSPSPSPDDAFAAIERTRTTITAVVPPLALAWLEAAPATTRDLSSLEVLQVGGAKLAPEVARRIEPALGVRLQQVFGMAEGLVNYTELDAPEDVRMTTQGRPMCPDDEVQIVDDEGRPLPDGTAGHLQTRGPYTIRAYHDDAAANARAFTNDGFYRTGDIVSRDARGYLTVLGRATDHINRGGEKISAEEIEDHLLAHPGVLDAAVVGVADTFLGERTCAFVIARGEAPTIPTLKAWVRGRGLAGFKVPDQVVFVEGFPSTGVGKISRKELRQQLRALAAQPTAGA